MSVGEDGHIYGWVLIDPETLEWCVRCRTREEARDLARTTGALIAKIEGAH